MARGRRLPGSSQRYTVERVRQALIEARGFKTVAARALQCEPNTIDNYIKRYPSLREALRGEREKQLDFAELQLLKAIADREPWAVAMYLKTIGKDRGYVERVDISVLIQQAVAKVAVEFDMTPDDLLAEASRYILEERGA
jgi:hypothetical protein